MLVRYRNTGGKKMFKGKGVDHVIKLVIPVVYRAYPELVPFTNGDRAGMFGKETATDFAKRKLAEQARADASGRPRKRGPNPKGRRKYIVGSLAGSANNPSATAT